MITKQQIQEVRLLLKTYDDETVSAKMKLPLGIVCIIDSLKK